MASKKIIVVFGATGNQGGSVVQTLLKDPEYEVRAITRDTSKPAAAALAEKGAIVLKADLDDKESLRVVLKDAYGVFAVTNFMDSFDVEREIQQGKNVADIAKELSIQHLIWSTLPHVSKVSGGKYTKVVHFDSKAIVEEYINFLGIPATFIVLGAFMESLPFFLIPSATGHRLFLPLSGTTQLPLISAKKDIGKYVQAILHKRSQVLGQNIMVSEASYSMEEIAQILRDDGGVDIVFESPEPSVYKATLEAGSGLPQWFIEDMDELMKFGEEFGLYPTDLSSGHALLEEKLETFREWARGDGPAALRKPR
ncbi:NmrA-like family protein [Bisporella sp. PMI_857]|nr:NmrA-like family protein [Bisporella sp. PMI_857]